MRHISWALAAGAAIAGLSACSAHAFVPKDLHYVALGDSYAAMPSPKLSSNPAFGYAWREISASGSWVQENDGNSYESRENQKIFGNSYEL